MAKFYKSDVVRMHNTHRKLWKRGMLVFGKWISWGKHVLPIEVHNKVASDHTYTYYSR